MNKSIMNLLFFLIGIDIFVSYTKLTADYFLQQQAHVSAMNHYHDDAFVVASQKKYSTTRLDYRVCQGAANANNSTEITQRRFCLTCKMKSSLHRHHDVSCGKRAMFLEQRYNYSTPEEAIRAVVSESPQDCCQRIPEKRKIEDGVPGVVGEHETNDNNVTTAWCILGGNNTPPPAFCEGFSHSAQALVPCWSYACRVRERLPEARCGIWFQPPQDSVFYRHYFQNSGGWVGDLMRKMNCSYHFGNDAPPNMSSSWYYRPDNLDWNEWFQDASDATRLSKAVFGKDNENSNDNDGSNPKLRIGLVQRRGQRRNITNLPEIKDQLQNYYSSNDAVVIEWAEMEDMSFMEQASFWHRQDVVVAAHGAAMTNALFMKRGAAAVEVFPIHYYVMMYQSLCETMDIHHFPYIDEGISYPEYDYIKHAGIRKVRYQLRSNPLTPQLDRIVNLIHQAVNASMKNKE